MAWVYDVVYKNDLNILHLCCYLGGIIYVLCAADLFPGVFMRRIHLVFSTSHHYPTNRQPHYKAVKCLERAHTLV